jgi:5-methylthioadenosine/S-adenosylhomocysteine deaminase
MRNNSCETFEACGIAKFICVSDPASSTVRADETYDDIHTQLYNILEGIGYPAEEQYGRGDELLELVQCQ